MSIYTNLGTQVEAIKNDGVSMTLAQKTAVGTTHAKTALIQTIADVKAELGSAHFTEYTISALTLAEKSTIGYSDISTKFLDEFIKSASAVYHTSDKGTLMFNNAKVIYIAQAKTTQRAAVTLLLEKRIVHEYFQAGSYSASKKTSAQSAYNTQKSVLSTL
tara:strand:- start:383 stop:865 length:483 start_codon:yes stop_codon:yes gene_type:complete